MPFVTEWGSADRRNLVVFTPDVLRIFKKHQQRFFWQTEGGGLLLGLRRGHHLEVVLATEPSHQDSRSTFSFVREVDGHAEVAKQAWLQGEKKIDYLGEWHTHPQKVPTPSKLDRHEWEKILLQQPKLTPMLFVVVGTQSMHVELHNGFQEKALSPLKRIDSDREIAS